MPELHAAHLPAAGYHAPNFFPDKPGHTTNRPATRRSPHRKEFTAFSGMSHRAIPAGTTPKSPFTGVGPEGVRDMNDIRTPSRSIRRSRRSSATTRASPPPARRRRHRALSWNRKGGKVPPRGATQVFKQPSHRRHARGSGEGSLAHPGRPQHSDGVRDQPRRCHPRFRRRACLDLLLVSIREGTASPATRPG